MLPYTTRVSRYKVYEPSYHPYTTTLPVLRSMNPKLFEGFTLQGAGHVDVVRLLVEAGAHKDFTNMDGDSALLMAALRGHVDVVRLLVEAGADKDLANYDGYTALLIADLHGYVDVVRFLVEAGVDKDLPNYDGFTPLMLAAREDHVEVGVSELRGTL